MPRPRHLTFANIASASALTIAVAGGGVAAAAVAANSVGSAQIKNGAVKSVDVKNNGLKGKDIKNDSLTGKDVRESSLAKVPSAGSVDKLTFGPRVSADPGQTVNVATRGPLTIQLVCTDTGGGNLEAQLNLITSANGAAFDANVSGGDEDILNVGDSGDIATATGTTQSYEHVGFSALTPSGELWQGYGMVVARFAGSNTCSTQNVYLG